MLLKQILKNVEAALELAIGKRCKSFEALDWKRLKYLERLLVEI